MRLLASLQSRPYPHIITLKTHIKIHAQTSALSFPPMSLLPQDIIPIPSPFKPLQTKSNIHTKHGGPSLHKQNSTTHLSTPSQATDEDAPPLMAAVVAV
ncbi:hypothetical protein Hdeb2414_s0105g00795381 [Helianthus debilis subsp. tardiflorus]